MMSSYARFIAIALIFTSAIALGTTRLRREKGARAHASRIAAGNAFACVLLDDGIVQCWGHNTMGQVGDGVMNPSAGSPVDVLNLGIAVTIAAGEDHACAIVSGTGGVRCWGRNTEGQLGNGTLTNRATPVNVTGMVNAVALSAGLSHTCAIRVDGTVWCWGDNSHGQLGSVSPGARAPLQVSGLTNGVLLASGLNHTCALIANGTVRCWGDNSLGELGNSSLTASSVPVPLAPLANVNPGVGVVDLTARGQYTCALLSDGSVYCWGLNNSGQLGNGSSQLFSAVPVRSSVIAQVVALAAGLQQMGVILARGGIGGWGTSPSGIRFDPPAEDLPGSSRILELALGDNYPCVLSGTDVVVMNMSCVGGNLPADLPQVPQFTGTFLGRDVSAGSRFACGQRGTGVSACWGTGLLGQLGNASNLSFLSPVPPAAMGPTVSLSAGRSHACAVDGAGAAFCWGDNTTGQLGDLTTANRSQPVAVSPVFIQPDYYAAVSAGADHTCGLTITGQVLCWGANDRGQLGIGNAAIPQVTSPKGAGGPFSYVAVAAGTKFTCALVVDGTVRCWGDNSSKQLGDGGAEAFLTSSKAVPGLANVIAIAAGVNHACALTASGTVFCWGANSRGQIGNNSTQAAPSPVSVQGLSDAVAISAGDSFTCAVQAAGIASCWGANESGQLGAKDSLDHLTPALVASSVFLSPTGGIIALSLANVAAITTGANHACALLATGVIRCWGDNSEGEIGDGTTTNRARPAVVNSFAANVDPAATVLDNGDAEVTVLINCEAGRVRIKLTLEQNALSETAHAVAACENRLERVPIRVRARGLAAFQAGGATASVEAIVHHHGRVVDDTHWTRTVTLSVLDQTIDLTKTDGGKHD